MKTIVIALGGNAINQADQKGTTEEQLANVDATSRQIARIARRGVRVVVTHGNGPQAGALLIQQEEADPLVPAQTLAACDAMTQGQIGWMIQNRLDCHLAREGLPTRAASVVTQVLVSLEDPDFEDPSKPVGPFYSEEEAARLARGKGYRVRNVKPGAPRGWRRVVPSPEPLEIIEQDIIRRLLDQGVLVIASGGGGIPVSRWWRWTTGRRRCDFWTASPCGRRRPFSTRGSFRADRWDPRWKPACDSSAGAASPPSSAPSAWRGKPWMGKPGRTSSPDAGRGSRP